MTLSPTPPALAELAFHACHAHRPVPGHGPLIDALRSKGAPDFTARVSRGGWYRPGRILSGDGSVIADDALAWLEDAWRSVDEDGVRLADRLRERGYLLTRELGVTHYLVAVRGKAPADYLQLEIEELREVISHPLGQGFGTTAAGVTDAEGSDAGHHGAPAIRTPDSVESLLVPPVDAPPPQPQGPPRYRFRRVLDMAAQIAALAAQPGQAPAVMRFLDEWATSSAGRQRHFSDHWVLTLREHLDRYRQTRLTATPFAAHPLPWAGIGATAEGSTSAVEDDTLQGTALAQRLYDYDRLAGYTFAWYFQMVSSRKVPRSLAARVDADLHGDMAYLPARDAALVAGWVAEPYSL
ncbi:MAG: hypothetical protein ACK4KV_19685 [Rhodocyclaceae bacterium]